MPKSQKLRFHTATSPSSTGRLAAAGRPVRCSSTARNPASISEKRSGPMAIISAAAAAEHSEKRPPTQSHSLKTAAGSIPKATAASGAAVAAAK